MKKLSYKQMQEKLAERDRDFWLARAALQYFAEFPQLNVRIPPASPIPVYREHHEGEWYTFYLFGSERAHGGIVVIVQETPQPDDQPALISVTPHYADDLRQDAREHSSYWWRSALNRVLEINDRRAREAAA